jgi:hypothetical protein
MPSITAISPHSLKIKSSSATTQSAGIPSGTEIIKSVKSIVHLICYHTKLEWYESSYDP